MFKSLIYYKYKTFLIVLSATTAIASIFLITSLSGGLISMYSKMLKTDSNFIILQKGVGDTFFSDVDINLSKSIKKLDYIKDVYGVIVSAGKIDTIPIAGIYGVSKNRYKFYKLIKGSYPKNNKEVIIGKKIENLLNHPNSVHIFGKEFKVSGVYESSIGFEDGGVVMPIKIASKMFKKSSSFLLVSLKNIDVSYKKVIKDISKLNDNISVKRTDDFIENYNQFKIIKISSGTISFISFFMGFLSIVSIMSIMIQDRKFEFGIKRAMGISRFKILSEVILEVTAIILLSYIIALALAELILYILKNIDRFQGYLNGEITLSIGIIVFFGSILMALFSSFIPAFIASKIDPIILINQGKQ